MPVLYFPVTKGLLMEACTQDHSYRQQLDTQNPLYGGPTAPPARMFDTVPGYEGTSPEGSGGGFLPPPDAGLPYPPGEPAPAQTEWNIPSISEDTARDALVQYASSKCCYSTDPAEQLVFSNLEAHNTYRYRLETFTESRSTEWAHEAYSGMPAPDLPQGGGASAPPGEMMHNVPGYEETGSGGGVGKCVPPPNPGLASPGRGPSPPERQWEIPSISEDFAKDAFIEYASSKCCYSSRPAKELVFTDLQAHNTYRYRLETFIESRKTEWDSVPYTGQVVDSYGSCVPAPWDIAVQVPAMFQNGKRAVQVPHTSSVKRQTIELIPVTRVHYTWKEKTYIYFVYGAEHKVYTDDYPAKCVLDPEAPEEGPSAPPSGLLDTVSGYEGTPSEGVGEDKIYPPPSDRVPKPENDRNASVPHVRLPTVSEDTARAALLEYVGSKWTYRSKPAKELVFRDLTPFTTYRVTRMDLSWKTRMLSCATDAMGKAVSDAVNVMDGVRCSRCSGRGTKTCDICKGHRNLMHFIQLIVTWKNQIYEHVPDQCPGFPVKLFEKVNGDKFFVDESALVYPIVGFPEEEICDASKRGNDEHMARFSQSMHILQQRQTIELIPLTQAFYEYKEQEYNYFVYGIENKVHAPKYPSSCSIL
ncbi:UNVERIFIED_CONTAM: hypothetical protein FKN15_018440 [Acipenser sinensis]